MKAELSHWSHCCYIWRSCYTTARSPALWIATMSITVFIISLLSSTLEGSTLSPFNRPVFGVNLLSQTQAILRGN